MVAIKDFEMPKKCIWDCPLCNEEGGACQLSDVKTSGVKRPSDCPLVEAIPKSEYKARLKADLEAILVELQLEIEEIKIDNNVPSGFEPVSKTSAFYEGVSASSKVIQEKINELKAESEKK